MNLYCFFPNIILLMLLFVFKIYCLSIFFFKLNYKFHSLTLTCFQIVIQVSFISFQSFNFNMFSS